MRARASGSGHARRRVLGGALLLTIGIAGQSCSGGGDGPTEPSSSTPQNGTGNPSTSGSIVGGWTGTTSQGLPIAILVNASNGIVLMMIGSSVAGATCTNSVTTFVPREPPDQPVAVGSGGSFTHSSSGSSGTLAVAGTLSASGTASGTLTINDTKCTGTLNATWTATRASSAEVNLAGTWNGTFASSLVARVPGVITVTQSAASVTGSFNIPSNGATGTIAGTVSGRMVTFTFTQTTVGCAGTFTGHGVLMPSPELLVYYYSGSDCLGSHSFGSGSASRQ